MLGIGLADEVVEAVAVSGQHDPGSDVVGHVVRTLDGAVRASEEARGQADRQHRGHRRVCPGRARGPHRPEANRALPVPVDRSARRPWLPIYRVNARLGGL